MLWQHGYGTFKTKILAPYVNKHLNNLVRDVKHQGMNAYQVLIFL